MVAQEDGPLAVRRNLRRLPQYIGDGKPVLARDRHVHARHQREVECHVAFVIVAEIVLGVLGPLIGFCQQHAVRIMGIEFGTNSLQDRMRFGQILVIGALAFHQIRHRIQSQPINAKLEPIAQNSKDLLQHARIVEIQIRLVRVEPMPVICARHLVPRPVGTLAIDEDDARAGIFVVIIRPDIEVAIHRSWFCTPSALEPRMLVGGMVDHQLGDDPHAARMRRRNETLGIGECPVVWMDATVVADVVAIVQPR